MSFEERRPYMLNIGRYELGGTGGCGSRKAALAVMTVIHLALESKKSREWMNKPKESKATFDSLEKAVQSGGHTQSAACTRKSRTSCRPKAKARARRVPNNRKREMVSGWLEFLVPQISWNGTMKF